MNVFQLDSQTNTDLNRFLAEPCWTSADVDVWQKQYLEDAGVLLEQLKQRMSDPNRYLMQLHLTMELALKARSVYQQQGITDRIWQDTFTDIAIWARHCQKHYGLSGLAQIGWLANHLRLKVFRLGRLQFEPTTVDEKQILYVHIAEGEPLVHQDCLDSYRQAKAFFQDRWTWQEILCHTWLLSPVLRELLPANANILLFQSDYEILRIDENSRQAEERIFGQILDDPALYPVQTTLQRAARDWLMAGQKIPAARGRLIVEGITFNKAGGLA